MSGLRLLTADMRRAEKRGPKVLIVGIPGIGKTSLLGALAPETLGETLLVDAEAGDLAVAGLPIASVRPRTWPEIRDIAAAVGGANPARPTNAAYSQAHYDAVVANPDMAELTRYSVVFIDSLTEISRICRAWAELQPESLSDRGKKDLRGTYGLVARELIGMLQQMQHARAKTVIFVSVLEKVTDDFGASHWGIQLEGQRTGRELPAIVDEVITMHFVDFGDGKPRSAPSSAAPTRSASPARTGPDGFRQFEEPHLGKLLEKLTQSTIGRVKMAIDFSDYDDLIRAGTVATVQIRIRYGDGADNVLTHTKAGDAEMLKLELTVLEGEYAKRKFFASWLVNGTTEGQKSIGRAQPRDAQAHHRERQVTSTSATGRRRRSPSTRWSCATSTACASWPKSGSSRAKTATSDKNILVRAITQRHAAMGQPSAVRPDPARPATSGGPHRGDAAGGAPPAPIAKPRGPREMRTNRHAAISADRDKWTKQAFDACIAAAKDLIGTDGPIRPGVPIGLLTKSEWGWFVSTVVSAWVRIRSEQAASEGWNYERAAHATGLEPDPWVQGAVASILPKLVEACPDLDWSKPVGEWDEERRCRLSRSPLSD